MSCFDDYIIKAHLYAIKINAVLNVGDNYSLISKLYFLAVYHLIYRKSKQKYVFKNFTAEANMTVAVYRKLF